MRRKSLFASAMAICPAVMIAPRWQAIGPTDVPSPGSPDRTTQRERGKSGDSMIPTKQSEARSDIDLVARIRREINKDNALSITTKDLKIIIIDRRVTLRGPVRTEREKLDIEARAAAIAGSSNIDDQLKVATQGRVSELSQLKNGFPS